jgi:protocatechuate 3,4-dioxygenase beta subunit
MLTRPPRSAALAVALLLSAASSTLAQNTPARFLAREDIVLHGIGLKVEPAQQTVPKDIATIVSTYLQATTPNGVPPFSPDAEVRATLVGPSFGTPRDLVVRPNTPFAIPPLSVPGVHTLENIRLVSNGEVLMYGSPQSVRIEVIERLLVTQVTARPLSAAEIREMKIVFDKTNFQAYNFSAAFAIEDKKVNLNFPVLLPSLATVADQANQPVTLQTIGDAQLPTLQTIIPDTLRIQTQLPNLTVVGFTLRAPTLQGKQLIVPPIPGVIAIPGDIGFLNQFFSVMLMVGNVAPPGSGLVVSNVQADIVLPPGKDGNVGSSDDPLGMAQTTSGPSPKRRVVVQPGLDAKLGTADDIATIGPGETGNAEYLVEGRREGSHVIEMQISATLHGLPVGPVPVTGRAAGAVLVRNPKFTLTFTHPEVVSAGEPYTLDVTVTNTSTSPANIVSLNLYPSNVVGAIIVGEPTRQIESIPPGDSASVSFDLISRTTGRVTAATLDSDENVAGRFGLKTAVGELGVPPSPDSLVLPKEAAGLPQSLRDATIGLLGKAWAVATAPAAALPPDLSRFSKKIVLDRAVETAEAGLRVSLHEPLPDSVAQLAMDFMGSNYNRLPTLVKPADLTFEQDNFRGFDELRRKSVRGDVFARAVAAELASSVQTQGVGPFHRHLGEKWSYRPEHVSVFASATPGSAAPYELSVVDSAGRRLGGSTDGKISKEIPYSDLLPFFNAAQAVSGELAVLAAPQAGALKIRLKRRTGVAAGPITLSLLVPTTSGALRHLTYQLASGDAPAPLTLTDSAYSFTFDIENATSAAAAPSSSLVADPAPTVISVIQQKDADQLRCEPDKPGFPAGRIVAVLFSEEVTAASVQDRLIASKITNYEPDANRVVGVALQPGRRIAFLALRDPIGPFVPRSITISNITDLRGQTMSEWSGPMEITINNDGAVVRGRVLDAFGTPIPFADVRLFYQLDCGIEPQWVGISAKTTDQNGAYSWDYVAKPLLNRILAVNSESDEFRNVQYNVQRQGQQLNVDIVFLGRGSIRGTVRSEAGVPLRDSVVRVTSLTDQSQYSATTDQSGRYEIARIPVGNIFIEAVNVAAKAQFAQAETIPMAGAVVERDLTLLDVEQRKITVKHGTIRGRVYRADGVTPVGGLPVFAYYQSLSQPGVSCPPGSNPCPIARATTGPDGSFSFVDITAGRLQLSSFDQTGLSQADVSVVLAENAVITANLLLSGGVGTVQGRVLTADGTPVNGAQVGGGLTLTTTNGQGEFTLIDVPVGHREIVAASQALGAIARTTVDVTRAGEVVSTTLVFEPQGKIAGRVVQADGTTPASAVKVYVFRQGTGGGYEVVGSDDTDSQGAYLIEHVPAGTFKVSAFSAGFVDGNIVTAAVKFNGQTARADIRFRGGNGKITGVVFNNTGNTPLRASVGVSGDRVRIAGGLVGVAFERVENFAIAESNLTTGQFALSDILVGPFTLNAVGQFSPDPISFEGAISSPGQTVNVELRLQATSQIRGAVTNPDGTPAPAEVIVRYKSEAYKVICTTGESGEDQCVSIPQGIQEETVLTDNAGRFWLPLVNAGPFSLTIEDPKSGRVAQARGSVRPGDTAEIPVRLLARGSLQVRVRASNTTTVIPGAAVTVKQLGYPQFERERTADQNGVVTFAGGDGLTEGAFVVEAVDVRNGFSGRGQGKIVTDGAQIVLNVHLFDAVGTVHGVVYDSDGFTPVPNADVIIANAQGPLAFSVTGADGTYSLEGIPLGAISVDVFDAKSGRRSAGAGQIDFAGQQVPINIVLSAIGLVKGIVLDSQTRAPLKGWTVTLAQQSASGVSLPALTTTTGVDGRFTIPGAARGGFTLTARKKDVNGVGEATGALDREGQVVDVPMLVTIARPLRGTISGAVLASTGAPAANAIVEICASTCSGAPTPILADGNGLFSLPDVALGRFNVRAKSQTSHDAGSTVGELRADGETASVVVAMEGVAQVTGTVERADGSPVASAQVVFEGFPATTCGPNGCTAGTNGAGQFSFVEQPARSFTVTATDPLSQLKGTAGGPLASGEHRVVRIVLAPSASLSGRVFTAGGQPASGIVAELIVGENTGAERRLYKETNADGTFVFPAAPLAPYRLRLFDPVGLGIASRTGQLTTTQALGDIVLDEAPPAVTSLTPAAASRGVALNQALTIVFSEPIQPSTVRAANIQLAGPAGPVASQLDVNSNDTTVVLTPLSALAAETTYTLRVHGITDRVGREMSADYTAAFTTLDVTIPTIAEASPAANTGGVTIYSPIRVRFSEPIDPTKFVGPPIILTVSGANVSGRLDYLPGNTILVFTPLTPLVENTVYKVRVAAATDLAGKSQPSPTEYQFSTTDRTPPVIPTLVAANNGKVIENGIASVQAEVGTTHDILFVDFYLNGQLAFVDRAEPFAIDFQATPQLGAAGSSINVSAIATDTSGNRGTTATSTSVTVVADKAPSVVITKPTSNISAAAGQHIAVDVRATDDLGVNAIGYRASTGKPADAVTRPVSPALIDRTESFGFNVPADAEPGSVIAIEATAADTFGHIVAATPVQVTVLDSVSPVVTITGATTGAQVSPGQATTVVVTATDQGSVSSITFKASGVMTANETRQVSPAQQSAVTSFTVTVPTTAQPGQSLLLDATAVDKAGNSGAAARVILPIADSTPPVITLTPESGVATAVPGRPVRVIASATDETGVTRLNLSTTGAVAFTDAKQVTPPLNSAVVTFEIPVPANAQVGSTIAVKATATDISNRTSSPASLTLTVVAGVDVTLPASALLDADATADVAVQLAAPAPAGGVTVSFTSSNTSIVTVPVSIAFAQGESSKLVKLTGVAGGTAQVRALVGGTERATMTVTVAGGIVSGIVRNSLLVPVGGAQVTVSTGLSQFPAVTDANGVYRLTGVAGPSVSVRVIDPISKLYGHETGTMAQAQGVVAVNVVLIPAGAIAGTVTDATDKTVGQGVRVDIFSGSSSTPLATTFTTSDGKYEFPKVTLGTYTLQASAGLSRGRATVSLATSGQQLEATIKYLGTGTVTGTVRIGGVAVANAKLTFESWSIFGRATPIVTNAAQNGTFSFTGVPIGNFAITAEDLGTQQKGSATGAINSHGQSVTANVNLASYGVVTGTVRRADGTTIVAGAIVRFTDGDYARQTETAADGTYRFEVVPLGNYVVTASEAATRSTGSTPVVVNTHLATKTANVQFLPQGKLRVTVNSAGGQPVASAFVLVTALSSTGVEDRFSVTTGGDGTVLIDHVLAGTFTLGAFFGSLDGTATGALASGELKNVTITLTSTGSITGTVVAPDGSPIAGAHVTVVPTQTTVTTNGQGVYRIDGLRADRYEIEVRDAANRLRARTSPSDLSDDAVISTQGQVVTRDFKMIGLGTVTGRVVFGSNGQSAGNVSVVLNAAAPLFELIRSVKTDAGGLYEFEDVPVGPVTSVVSNTTQQLYGEASGVLPQHGAEIKLDISLTNNAITLPRTLWDANNQQFDVQAGGQVSAGTIFNGDNSANRGAFMLDLTSGGTTTRFAGGEVPTIEDSGREIVVRQENLFGLSVTRKIFVPRAGYFARYLEILRNPTANPVTVDLKITGHIGGAGVVVDRSSSGDAVLDIASAQTADTWFVAKRSDTAAAAFVFDGAGGAKRVTQLSLTPLQTGSTPFARAVYGWNTITIPAGGTVALMHFGVQQTTREAGRASAERLASLPPEALAGLSAEELAAIRNFVVPSDGQSTLAPLPALTGSVTGKVFEGDKTTPIQGAQVRFVSTHPLFPNTQTASSAADGRFTFTGAFNNTGTSVAIPVAGFTLTAVYPFTQVVAPAVSGGFAAHESAVERNVVFDNAGALKGVVRRHNGTAVTSGTVSLTGGGTPATNRNVSIAGDASYRAGGLPPGNYSLIAEITNNLGTGLKGTATATVAAGPATVADISIEPTGTLSGVVKRSSTQVAANVTVKVTRTGFSRERKTDSSGGFMFTDMPVGSFTVTATEPTTEIQTSAPVTIAADQTTTQNLMLATTGRVIGVVSLDGVPQPNLTVTLRSMHPLAGRFWDDTTDAGGAFEFDAVPLAAFSVTVFDLSRQLFGEAAGRIDTEGQQVTVTVALVDSAITMPETRWDASNFEFDIQPGGELRRGTLGVFGNTTGQGGAQLELQAGSTPVIFTGNTVGTYEDGGREIATRQNNVAGVDVTRKVFVPRDGYFARYLEILTNSTSTPVSLKVRLRSRLGGFNSNCFCDEVPDVVRTSSGDDVFAPAGGADRWVTLASGADVDPFENSKHPALAFVFGGANAALTTGAGSYTKPQAGSLEYEWQNVTIAPGVTVAFMHFVVQQTSTAGALASASRLTALPPEALAGLSPAEIASIRNFAVPANGTSALEPLPLLTGSVQGRTLSHDGGVVVPSVSLTFKSENPLFGRRRSLTSDQTGAFTLVGELNDFGSSIAVPVGAFTLTAMHSLTQAEVTVTGNFTPNTTATTKDVPFIGTGTVAAVVKTFAGTPIAGANAYLSPLAWTTTTDANGRTAYPGLQPGTYTISSRRAGSSPFDTPIEVVATVEIGANQTQHVTLTYPAVGGVTGRLLLADGATVATKPVRLSNATGFTRYATTNGSGVFLFNDVPAGVYQLLSWHPLNEAPVEKPVTILGGQVVTQDIQLPGSASVTATVTFARGVAAAKASVYKRHAGTSGQFTTAGTTAADGTVTIASVPEGAFTIRAYYPSPQNFTYFSEATGTITGNGANTKITVVLPALGSVHGTLKTPGGAVVPSTYVQLRRSGPDASFTSAQTDQNGNFRFDMVPVGEGFHLAVAHRTAWWVVKYGADFTLQTDGEDRLENLTLPAAASVNVQVRRADKSGWAGLKIDVRDSAGTLFFDKGTTNASGDLLVLNVAEGAFTVRVRDAGTGVLLAELSGTVRPQDDALTVPFPIVVSSVAGNVQGRVFAADKTSVLAGAFVQVLDAIESKPLKPAVTTDANGNYSFSGVLAGPSGFIIRAIAQRNASTTADRTGSITTVGQTVTLDLVLPVTIGSLSGVVTAGTGGTPIAGASVTVMENGAPPNPNAVFTTTTNGQGAYQMPSAAFGGLFTVTVTAAGLTSSQQLSFATQGQALTANFVLPGTVGSVTGVVYAGDGSTPLPKTHVTALGATGGFLRSATTDANGSYSMANVFTSGPFKVRTSLLTNNSMTVETPVTFTSAGQQVTRNLVLPASVVKGHIANADGSDATNPDIFLEASDLDVLFPYSFEITDGNYLIVGAPVGAIRLTVQDPDSYLTKSVTSSVDAIATAVILNVTMPATGTVTGRVLDASGNPVTDAQVSLLSESLSFERSEWVNEQGVFTFTNVPQGAVMVHTRIYSSSLNEWVLYAGIGNAVANQSVTINATPLPIGTVTGRVLNASGQPVAGASVQVTSFYARTSYSDDATTNDDGVFTLTRVPAGDVFLTTWDWASGSVGKAQGTLAANSTLQRDVVLGSAVNLDHVFAGADGFRYRILSDGELRGGKTDGSLLSPYAWTAVLKVNTDYYCCSYEAAIGQNNRQITLGPELIDTIPTSRKVFVPESGGFVRYLEVLYNPTPTPRTVTVLIEDYPDFSNATRWLVKPTDTNRTFAVVDNGLNDAPTKPAVGFVMAGAGNVPVKVSAIEFKGDGSNILAYRYVVTVPPQQRVAILHYTLQRNPNDAAGAQSQAQSLVALTDPRALEGLSAAEKAMIVNFVITP